MAPASVACSLGARFRESGRRSTAGVLGVGHPVVLSGNDIGWDNASTVQGEVVDVHAAIRGRGLCAPACRGRRPGYPWLAALGAKIGPWWKEGVAAAASAAVAGGVRPGIERVVALAVARALALFNFFLPSYSRIPLAMVIDGFLPRALARLDLRGTPRNAVLASAVRYSVGAPFIPASCRRRCAFTHLALFLEFGALLSFGEGEPSLRGPFWVPLGLAGVHCGRPSLIFFVSRLGSCFGVESTNPLCGRFPRSAPQHSVLAFVAVVRLQRGARTTWMSKVRTQVLRDVLVRGPHRRVW